MGNKTKVTHTEAKDRREIAFTVTVKIRGHLDEHWEFDREKTDNGPSDWFQYEWNFNEIQDQLHLAFHNNVVDDLTRNEGLDADLITSDEAGRHISVTTDFHYRDKGGMEQSKKGVGNGAWGRTWYRGRVKMAKKEGTI